MKIWKTLFITAVIIGLFAPPVVVMATSYYSEVPSVTVTVAKKCLIKGNATKKGKTVTKIYHLPGTRYYKQTVIRPKEGDRYFCAEKEAKKAGFRKSK